MSVSHGVPAGEAGSERLSNNLEAHVLFGGDEGLLREASAVMGVIELGLDDVLIGDGRGERDLFLILSGAVSVRVSGREVATRSAGEYVGEFALIDSETKRSASVVAKDKTVVGCFSEPEFAALAAKYPILWRNLAIDLVRRLLDRQVRSS